MRIYPNADVHFYIEYSNGWDRYCRWPQEKSWKRVSLNLTDAINYWRDLEGSKKSEIKNADLYFDNWITSRIREAACLPIYYAVGNRFIRITKAFPAGFKCAPVPLNLVEARAVRSKIKEEEKAALKLAKLEKKRLKLEKAAEKAKKKK